MSVGPATTSVAAPVAQLGSRLRAARLAAGLTLRELARQLKVSPSFVSQLENGKSQPSVATLYSLSQLLDVSIDVLFETDGEVDEAVDAAADGPAGTDDGPDGGGPDHEPDAGHGVGAVRHLPSGDEGLPGAGRHVDGAAGSARGHDGTGPLDDQGLFAGSPGSVAEALGRASAQRAPAAGTGGSARFSITAAADRSRLVMDSGVIWQQLARNTDHHLDFIEITYPAGSSSTTDERMLRHQGFEYGYLLEGELQVTFGFDRFVLRAGESLGLDSSVPHLFTNTGDVAARGIWFVHHRHD